jgi:hypothetical protein
MRGPGIWAQVGVGLGPGTPKNGRIRTYCSRCRVWPRSSGQEHERFPLGRGSHQGDQMTKALVKTQIRLQQLTAKRDAGQGTLEYVGMIVVAAILVAIVAAVVNDSGIQEKFQAAVDKIVGP